MRKLRWQLLIAIGGLILVIGLLIRQTPDSEISSPQPIKGGVYSEALVGEIIRLNPILDTVNQPDRDIDKLIYSGIVSFDSRGIPQQDIAESWAVSADATLYTITLRDNAYWHDGEPVTSDDVIYTFSKFQDDDFPGPEDLKAFWKQVNIIRLDDKSVQFQLPEPYAPFLDYLSVGLLPDHLLRGVSVSELVDHPFNLEPIGSGPFQFDRFIIDEGEITGVSLSVNTDFYGERPFLERIEFKLYPDQVTALHAYLDDEVAGLGHIGREIFADVLDMPDTNIHSSRLPELGMIFLNLQHPEKEFLSDKHFRQALLYAVNRQFVINSTLDGQALIANGPIMPGTWAYAENLPTLDFDPEKAAAILDSLEWELPAGAQPGSPEFVRTKDDQVLAIDLVHPDDVDHVRIAEIIKAYWENVGIKVNLTPASQNEILNTYLEPREFEAVLTDVNFSGYPDPDPYPFWHDSQTETGQNYAGFEDRNTSIWLEQARTTPDLGRRADLYKSFQYRFQDQQPSLMLYYLVYNYGIDPQVQGVTVGPLFDPSDRHNTITNWHLLARRGLNLQATETSEP
jgi:peptide/nickel transport system substrate-binding protein